MSDLFSIFQPGYEHTRRQKELDKVLVVDMKKGGRGRQPLDLESGSVTIDLPSLAPGSDTPSDPSRDTRGAPRRDTRGAPRRDTQRPPSNDANEVESDETFGL